VDKYSSRRLQFGSAWRTEGYCNAAAVYIKIQSNGTGHNRAYDMAKQRRLFRMARAEKIDPPVVDTHESFWRNGNLLDMND